MEQKPVIQYVGQFYVYGSEVQAGKKEERKEKRSILPSLPKPKREHCVYVDPVAVGGIAVAVMMLVVLVIGALQLRTAMEEYNEQMEILTAVKRENATLEHRYRTGLDLEDIQQRAEKMGMVPTAELEHKTVRVTVPLREKEPTAWENFIWFMKGLLYGVDERQAVVFVNMDGES